MPIPASSTFTSDPAAIEARWRPLTDGEREIAPQLLDDAAALLAARLPTLEARMGAGTVSNTLIERVQVAMVVRVLSNPDGKRQESIDDYSWTRDNAVSAGMLYVAPDEVAQLLPKRPHARTVSLIAHPQMQQ